MADCSTLWAYEMQNFTGRLIPVQGHMQVDNGYIRLCRLQPRTTSDILTGTYMVPVANPG